jgi:hypothetical protein
MQLYQRMHDDECPEALADEHQAWRPGTMTLGLLLQDLDPLLLGEFHEVGDKVLKALEVAPGTVRLAEALCIRNECSATDMGKSHSKAVIPHAMLHLAMVDKDNRPHGVVAVARPLLEEQGEATRCTLIQVRWGARCDMCILHKKLWFSTRERVAALEEAFAKHKHCGL